MFAYILVQVSAKTLTSREVKSGFLLKIGQGVKSWKKRYFIFDGEILFYFENASSTKQKGEISFSIDGCLIEFGCDFIVNFYLFIFDCFDFDLDFDLILC